MLSRRRTARQRKMRIMLLSPCTRLRTAFCSHCAHVISAEADACHHERTQSARDLFFSPVAQTLELHLRHFLFLWRRQFEELFRLESQCAGKHVRRETLQTRVV